MRRRITIGVLLVLVLSLGVYCYWSRINNPTISIFPTTPGTRWVYEWTYYEDTGEGTELKTDELLKVSQDGKALLAIKETSEFGGLPSYRYYEVNRRSALDAGTSVGENPLEGYCRSETATARPRRVGVGSTWREGSFAFRALRWASVETRAGKFPKALVIEFTNQGGYSFTEYYVDGIGLVKQTADDVKLLELVEFTPGK